MHKCDNPKCVNPDHLEAGTQSQNILDAYARGRKPKTITVMRGEKHGGSKFKAADIHAIRDSSMSIRQLAALYGVNKSTIERIRHRKSWAHI